MPRSEVTVSSRKLVIVPRRQDDTDIEKNEECEVNNNFLLAVEKGNISAMRVLLSSGANTNETGGEVGNTVLIIAAKNGRKSCLDLLISTGLSINARNNLGQSAILIASSSGFTECLLSILKAPHCDVNITDRRGCSSLILAAYNGHVDCIGPLLDAGAALEVFSLYGRLCCDSPPCPYYHYL